MYVRHFSDPALGSFIGWPLATFGVEEMVFSLGALFFSFVIEFMMSSKALFVEVGLGGGGGGSAGVVGLSQVVLPLES